MWIAIGIGVGADILHRTHFVALKGYLFIFIFKKLKIQNNWNAISVFSLVEKDGVYVEKFHESDISTTKG